MRRAIVVGVWLATLTVAYAVGRTTGATAAALAMQERQAGREALEAMADREELHAG